MSLVSVVVPAYNGEAFLAESLESALDQTHGDIEVIVVDDGSTDGTPAVLERFAGRVAVIRQPNRGQSVARNRGLTEARGTYVAFLDQDDLWEPTFVEMLAARLAALDESVVGAVAGWEEIDATGLRRPDTRFTVAPSYGLRDLTQRCWAGPSGVMLRRDAVRAVGGWDERFLGLQDWDLWLRLAASGGSFSGVDAVLWLYRQHSGNLSLHFERLHADILLLCDRHLASPALPLDVRQDLRHGLGVYLFSLAVSLYARGADDAGHRALADAVRVLPTLLDEAGTYWAVLGAGQPPPVAGETGGADLGRGEARVLAALETVLGPSRKDRRAGDAYGLTFAALARLAYKQRRMATARGYVARALRAAPSLWFDRELLGVWLKSLAGAQGINTASRWKRTLGG